MARPTFIVAEPEPEQALSSRKLLLETFKFNVITAHSEEEMHELIEYFPRVDAIILHGDTPGSSGNNVIHRLKQKCSVPIISLSPGRHNVSSEADHVVNSHNPEELLHLLQRLFGDARKMNGGPQLPGDK